MNINEVKKWWAECGTITSLSFEETVCLTQTVDNLIAEVERLKSNDRLMHQVNCELSIENSKLSSDIDKLATMDKPDRLRAYMMGLSRGEKLDDVYCTANRCRKILNAIIAETEGSESRYKEAIGCQHGVDAIVKEFNLSD
jgi:hypothetical protein